MQETTNFKLWKKIGRASYLASHPAARLTSATIAGPWFPPGKAVLFGHDKLVALGVSARGDSFENPDPAGKAISGTGRYRVPEWPIHLFQSYPPCP